VESAAGGGEGGDAAGRAVADEESGRLAAGREGAKRGSERLAELRRELNQTMERGCGVYREQSSMDETVRTVTQLKQRMSDVRLEDSSAVFNTELVAALELDNMIEVAE